MLNKNFKLKCILATYCVLQFEIMAPLHRRPRGHRAQRDQHDLRESPQAAPRFLQTLVLVSQDQEATGR